MNIGAVGRVGDDPRVRDLGVTGRTKEASKNLQRENSRSTDSNAQRTDHAPIENASKKKNCPAGLCGPERTPLSPRVVGRCHGQTHGRRGTGLPLAFEGSQSGVGFAALGRSGDRRVALGELLVEIGYLADRAT